MQTNKVRKISDNLTEKNLMHCDNNEFIVRRKTKSNFLYMIFYAIRQST